MKVPSLLLQNKKLWMKITTDELEKNNSEKVIL